MSACNIRGFPKIRATCLGVPIIRTIVFWGLNWGPLILGNYHMYIHVCMYMGVLIKGSLLGSLGMYRGFKRDPTGSLLGPFEK